MTPPGQDEIVAPTPPFDVISNYKGWTESAEHRAAVAKLARRMEDRASKASISSRLGRRAPRRQVRDPGQLRADREQRDQPPPAGDDGLPGTLWGQPIGFNEDDEGTMVPDLVNASPASCGSCGLPGCFCFYYYSDSGISATSTRAGPGTARAHVQRRQARRRHGGGHRARADVAAPQGRRRASTRHPFAFYEIAYLEEWEPILLYLIEHRRGMGLPISHADWEGQVPGRGQPIPGHAARRRSIYLPMYRELCRIVARKHGLIATFMAKPFMGCSAYWPPSQPLRHERGRREPAVGELKDPCRLSQPRRQLRGGRARRTG